MSATATVRGTRSVWHTVTLPVEGLSREVERLRRNGAVITGSRRTADGYVLTYVV
ncbi:MULTISPECIES: hypothetical protein [unclassified Nocardioides]|uniref:hypothetical protein n=1 Tax=unclassified Nocardioides TaxID=2615069 RepID=UPI000A419010|nr:MULTISPECIES: hypothetical protein [unclassified Nocardioides]